MNRHTLSAVLVALLLLPVIPASTGCKTWNQDKAENIAYKTLGSVATSVDAALKVYADAWAAGKVDAETDAKVESAHNKYRAAMATAIAAARLNYAAPASDEIVDLAETLINLIREVL